MCCWMDNSVVMLAQQQSFQMLKNHVIHSVFSRMLNNILISLTAATDLAALHKILW